MSKLGSPSRQINELVYGSGLVGGVHRGISDEEYQNVTRHEQKQTLRENGVKGSHAQAQFTRVSRGTARNYVSVYKDLAAFCKEQGFCKDDAGRFDLSRITPAQVREYLDSRASAASHGAGENGICKATLKNIISAVNKIDAFASKSWGHAPGLSSVCTQFRAELKSGNVFEKPHETRAFERPQAVISALPQRSRLSAEIQLRCGLRAGNATKFEIKANGCIAFVSKGGMRHDAFKLPPDLYNKVLAANGGKLGQVRLVAYGTYRDDVKSAAAAAGERISGKNTHSFRHNYARDAYKSYCKSGMSDKEARARVSLDLFHERLDVVSVYLR